MAYDKLKSVAVTFIMAEAKGKYPVERVRQYYDSNGEFRLYNDLITIYEVYVPSVVERKPDGDIYIFAKFFAICTEAEFSQFAREFSDNTLAKGLALMYSGVFTMERFRTLSFVEDDLFCGKSEEEIKEIGRLEGIVDMIKNMYKVGADVSTIQKFTGLDTAFIQSITV